MHIHEIVSASVFFFKVSGLPAAYVMYLLASRKGTRQTATHELKPKGSMMMRNSIDCLTQTTEGILRRGVDIFFNVNFQYHYL